MRLRASSMSERAQGISMIQTLTEKIVMSASAVTMIVPVLQQKRLQLHVMSLRKL